MIKKSPLKILYLFLSIYLFAYSGLQAQVQTQINPNKVKELSNEELKIWHQLDIEEDTIPGISLIRAYRELLNNKQGKDVIVAIIDTKLDIHHEDLKDQIWVNEDEIPGNNIDDDNNGYIDDVNGWDFLSNSKGEYIKYQYLETMRFIKKFEPKFKNKKENEIAAKDTVNFKMYTKVLASFENSKKSRLDFIESANKWIKDFPIAKEKVASFFKEGKYELKQLDSLIIVHEKDSIIKSQLQQIKMATQYEITPEKFAGWREDSSDELKYMLNMDFDERSIMGDDPKDISDAYYGSNIVYGDVPFTHSTGITGVLAANRSNQIGIEGMSDHIKIMPVVMVASGDEHDKDVALAIRYAVDNGAHIINMSWRKNYSLHQDWVYDAIKYAASKNVLLVAAGGNEGVNSDLLKSYPNDYNEGEELVNNFIVVGASSFYLDKKLNASFSNYGKNNVDIFAPGYRLYSTEVENTYQFGSGTSIASPIVAGVAALLKAYYPDLTAIEIKQILLKSGVAYEKEVRIFKEDKEELLPFSQLSKSGKIVNAYNALLMAEEKEKEINKK